VDLMNMILI